MLSRPSSLCLCLCLSFIFFSLSFFVCVCILYVLEYTLIICYQRRSNSILYTSFPSPFLLYFVSFWEIIIRTCFILSSLFLFLTPRLSESLLFILHSSTATVYFFLFHISHRSLSVSQNIFIAAKHIKSPRKACFGSI